MRKKYFPTPEEIEIVKDLYDGTATAISTIMRRTGRKYPRCYIKRLARNLGLARPKEKDWSPEEERYLFDHYPEMGLKALRIRLAQNFGVVRSHTGISIKIKRMGILSSDGEDFTLCRLCDFFGCDHHKIHGWMDRGWIHGRRRGTLRKENQGGDMWRFTPDDVRAFIIAHPEEIDLRRVDPVSFVRLVAGDTRVVLHCRCPRCKAEYEETGFNPGNHIVFRYCEGCRRVIAVQDSNETYAVGSL